MSAPFVTQLRTSRPAIELTKPGPGSITLRVESAELWDTVRVVARPDTIVAELKSRVVTQLYPSGEHVDDFVLKFRGWEVLDERASVTDAGLIDGSILLIAYRRRRAVK